MTDAANKVRAVTDLAFLDATAQAALVREGDATPQELVDAAIARVEQVNPDCNALIHTRFERAHDEAARTSGGPFRGVPIVVKDLDGPLAGEPYHLGNRLLRQLSYTAERDSYIVTKLRAAGFVVIGKTNTPEFGLLPTTEPSAYGATRNPWDGSRSPGGSSGGTGAAVAAGMVPLGHAGDGGGSIRIPASLCGLFGLKPTRARTSLGPDDGESWSGLVVRHVLTRSVRDSAAVLDALQGPMPGDPYTAMPPVRAYADEVGADPGSLRVGVCTDAPGGLVSVDAACAGAVADAAKLLESLGHRVEIAAPPALDDVAAMLAFMTILAIGVVVDVERLAKVAGRDIGPDDVETLTWSHYETGRTISAGQYVDALESARAWTRRMAEWWKPAGGFDLLLTPTIAEPALALGAIASDAPDPSPAMARTLPYGVFTAAFNMTGQPAMSVPLAWADETSPVGVQLVAATGREDILLRMATQLEAARPWSGHRPPLHA
jgi:amidase